MTPPTFELHQMAALGRLGVSMAHEINSPVASILSNSSVIRRYLEDLKNLLDHPEPSSLAKAVRIVETCQSLNEVDKIACERIGGIVRGIKNFARFDEGDRIQIDLNKEIQDTVRLATCRFSGRIQAQLDLNDLPEFVGYPQLLNQVFLNILVNGAQAIDSAGTITVTTRHDDRMIHILIADTGRGMTPEQKARVFQTGFTTKPRGEGTGFGLSISREIVEEKHGGTIDFESEIGVGTTFHIHLPFTASAKT